MAYIKKYSFPFVTKYEQDAVLELWEDIIDTTVYEYQGISFALEYIPSSDDPFEPIYATQLAITLDVTDEATGNTSANIPNLTTLNDRKYQAILKIGTDTIFTGWTLSDSVSLSFTTGRKQLSFNCVDGLAMLKNIKFSNEIAFDTNNPQSLITFISKSLLSIGFPTGLGIISAVSYYAEGMYDRGDGLQYEPFAQTFIFGNTFIDEEYEYQDCYSILNDILFSFGARIIQAKNKWYIYSINQFAQNEVFYTQYYPDGTLDMSGILTPNTLIQPYYNNTSNLYFINNTQTKLLKKGYNNIISNNDISFPSNLIYNWDLKDLTAGQPNGWVKVTTGTGTAVPYSYSFSKFDYWKMEAFFGTGSVFVLIDSYPYYPKGSAIKVSFDVAWTNFTTNVAAKLILKVFDGSQTFYYDKNKNWTLETGTIFYYEIPKEDFPPNALQVPAPYSLTTSPLPIGGEVQFGLYIDNNIGKLLTAGNFKLEVESQFKNVLIESKLSESEEYTLTINSPIGVPVNGVDYYNYKGYLMRYNGSMAKNWYRYEYKDVDGSNFRGLAQLLVRQYMNIYQKNIINLDCELSSVDTQNGIINGFTSIKVANDNDPASINIENQYYMFGNTTMDLYTDEIKTTLLQINNENVEGSSITTTYSNPDLAQELPENCFCYEIYGVEDGATYSYTDCDGNSNFMSIGNGVGVYVSALSLPSTSGCTATLVDSSFCTI